MAPLWNLASVLVLALAAAVVDAKTADGRLHGNIARRPSVPTVPAPVDGPVTSRNGTALPPYNQTYLFDQLIDHTNPSLGTFKQRFWTTAEWFEKGAWRLRACVLQRGRTLTYRDARCRWTRRALHARRSERAAYVHGLDAWWTRLRG